MQEAASRARVERRMGDLQAQLSALEGQLHARSHKVEQFVDERNRKISEGQRLAVSGALERSQLVNSMGKMRENLKAASSMYIDMPAARRNVQNPELKALLASHQKGARKPLYPHTIEAPVAIDKPLGVKFKKGDPYIYWPN